MDTDIAATTATVWDTALLWTALAVIGLLSLLYAVHVND